MPGVTTVLALALLVQAAALTVHADPQGRFRFSYPSRYGATAPGTNDGFEDRVAAVRFAAFPALLGGEAALTRGPRVVDLQAAGGLYDPIALEIFPAPLRALVRSQLPPLTPPTFCAVLAQERHLDLGLPAFASLPAAQREAIGRVDAMRNVNATVVRCSLTGDVAVFDKETSFAPAGPRQHVFGAMRFLEGRYSSFQLIAGGAAPAPALLAEMDAVVRSFVPAP
jgi:hypothetical protein